MSPPQLEEFMRVYRDLVEQRSAFPETEKLLEVIDSLIDRKVYTDAKFLMDYLIVLTTEEGVKLQVYALMAGQAGKLDILPREVSAALYPRHQLPSQRPRSQRLP